MVDYLDVQHKVEGDLGSSDRADRPDQQAVEVEEVERYPNPRADRSWDSKCGLAAGVAGAAAPGGEEAVAAVPARVEV